MKGSDKIKLRKTKIFTLNELPYFSPWPARLLGTEPYSMKYKTPEEVTREYEHEKWGPLLRKVHSYGKNISVEMTDEIALRDLPETLCSIGEKLHLFSPLDFNHRYVDFIERTLKKLLPASALVELGCGYGNIILKLAKRKIFSSMQIMAAEYTSSGMKLTRELAERQGLDMEVENCNFASPEVAKLPIPPNAIIFTSNATLYVPKLKTSFVSALSSFKPKAVVHFEPCFEHCDNRSLLGLMRRRYIEVNDYNRNLVTLLHKQQGKRRIIIHLEQPAVLGLNPLLAASVLIWSPILSVHGKPRKRRNDA